jgi:hypothetical protein
MSDPTPLAPSGDGEPRPEVIDRDPLGRFAPGNRAGRGNPHAARVSALRSALLDAVTPDDLRAVVAALVDRAKGGDVAAARELLDRAIGKPPAVLGVVTEPVPEPGGWVLTDEDRALFVALLAIPEAREVLTAASERAAVLLAESVGSS